MRIGVLKKRVKEYYEALSIKVSDSNINGRTYKVIDNWKEICTILYELREYKFVGNSVKYIFDLGANFQAPTQTTAIHISDYNKFVDQFDILKAKCKAICDMETNISYEDDESYLYVKLPEKLSDLEKLNEIIKGLEISINKCPILNDSYEKIEFIGVESGSNWLVLAVICTAGLDGLRRVADYIKVCNDIRIQSKTIRNLDIEYIVSKLKLEKSEEENKIQEIKKGIQEDKKKECLTEFKKINFDKEALKISPEDESKITHSMLTMIDLLEEGMEIYPSLNSTEELKDAFPKKEEWKLLDTNKKMIDEKITEKSDE